MIPEVKKMKLILKETQRTMPHKAGVMQKFLSDLRKTLFLKQAVSLFERGIPCPKMGKFNNSLESMCKSSRDFTLWVLESNPDNVCARSFKGIHNLTSRFHNADGLISKLTMAGVAIQTTEDPNVFFANSIRVSFPRTTLAHRLPETQLMQLPEANVFSIASADADIVFNCIMALIRD
jgi:hypothetical protein